MSNSDIMFTFTLSLLFWSRTVTGSEICSLCSAVLRHEGVYGEELQSFFSICRQWDDFKGAFCSFWGRNVHQQRSTFILLLVINPLSSLPVVCQAVVSVKSWQGQKKKNSPCLHDWMNNMWRTLPPLYLQCSGTLFSSESRLFIHLQKKVCVSTSLIL